MDDPLDFLDDLQNQPRRPFPAVPQRQKSLVQTIERTGKKWKAAKAIGFWLCVGSLLIIFSSLPAGSEQSPPNLNPARIGGFGILIGILIYIYGRIGAWWFHG